jgi:DNA-binding IclR family transcriptional regulator
VLDGCEVVYVGKIGGHRQATAPSRIGGRLPLYCTAVGKALLAFSPPELFTRVVETGLERRTPRTITAPGLLRRQLNQVAASGVAFEYEESAVGIACIGAPVLDDADRAVAAISVTGPVLRFRPEAFVPYVKAAAAGTAALVRRSANG